MAKMPEYPIEMCISNFDGYSKEIMDNMRPYSEYSSQTLGKAYTKLAAGGSFLEKAEAEALAKFKKFSEDALKVFGGISQAFAEFTAKKCTVQSYTEKILLLVASDEVLKNVQAGLHRLASEDFLQVEKMVLALVEGRPKVGRRLSHPKIQSKEDKERIMRMQKLVVECCKKFAKQGTELISTPTAVQRNMKTYTKKCCQRLLSKSKTRGK
jgi:hypothetical protein